MSIDCGLGVLLLVPPGLRSWMLQLKYLPWTSVFSPWSSKCMWRTDNKQKRIKKSNVFFYLFCLPIQFIWLRLEFPQERKYRRFYRKNQLFFTPGAKDMHHDQQPPSLYQCDWHLLTGYSSATVEYCNSLGSDDM